MRCTQCDSILFAETVDHLPDGRLVFGWCDRCLEAAGCTANRTRRSSSTRQDRLPAMIRPIVARAFSGDGRRLSLLGVAGLMAAWGLILAFIGGWRLPAKTQGPPSPFGNGTSSLLIAGGGVMAFMSLAIWLAVLGRMPRRQTALKFIEVFAALCALAVLAWGIVKHEPRRDPFLVALAVVALWISWLAHMAERRSKRATQAQSTLPRL